MCAIAHAHVKEIQVRVSCLVGKIKRNARLIYVIFALKRRKLRPMVIRQKP